MGNFSIIIQGVGAHHNYKKDENGKLIPDGKNEYERTTHDADYMAKEFVDALRFYGHNITHATITTGGEDNIDKIILP